MTMQLNDFSVGDHVRQIRSSGKAPVGATARVTGYDGPWLSIKWDEDYGQNDGGYYPASFMKIEYQVFYVVDEYNSEVLSEHSNQDAAEADAKACAEQTDAHDGIGVYKRIVVYKTKSELVEERA